MKRWGVLLLALLLLSGCTARPPVERPREGAPPAGAGPSIRLEGGPPPTLVGAIALSFTPTVEPPPTSSPSPVAAAASPSPSPGALPVISGLQPAPGATLPAGDVVVGARVSASGDIADVTIYIDGEAVPIDLGSPPARIKLVSVVRGFAVGNHELRIQARDDGGRLGGYRWQFTVGTPRQSVPPSEPRPVMPVVPIAPTATLFPIPTRRPTLAPTTVPVAKPNMQTPGPVPVAKPTLTPVR